MPYIVNKSDSIKTGIISVVSKNGDYIKKTFKNLTLKNLNSRINYNQTVPTQGKLMQYSFFEIEFMSPTHLVKLC